MSLAWPACGQELKRASSTIAAKISESGRKRVAVVDFTDLCGNVSRLGRYLAEELSGALVEEARGFRVMDRAHLKAILQEHKLATTGLIDPQTARQLGQFAGVDTLVTGTITSAFGDTVRVMVKALDVSTAEIIAQSTADIPKTDAVKNLLGPNSESGCEGIGGEGAGQTARSNPVGAQAQTGAKRPTFETESYRVIVESVRRSGNSVSIILTFQSVSDKKIPLAWGEFSFGRPSDRGPYLLDENGGKWVLLANDDARIVWHSGYGPVDLLPGTRIKTKFVFGGSGTARSFTLVCTEGAPNPGRDILIHGLTPD